MPTVPNRLYGARSPEGVDLLIPESEMPGNATGATGFTGSTGVTGATGQTGTTGAAGGAAPWSSITAYVANHVVFDRGGIWQCLIGNTNSQPVSGNVNWSLIGGTPYVEAELDVDDLTSEPFYAPTMTISGVNQGTKTFTVDAVPDGFTAGSEIRVFGSTLNDGFYTIASTTGTTIVVVEAIPNGTGDGFANGLGLSLVPAPGAGLYVSPKSMFLRVGAGTAWDVSPDVYIGWGYNGGQVPSIDPEGLNLDANFSVSESLSYTILTAGEGTIAKPVVNQPIRVWIQSAVAGGTRPAAVRVYYTIEQG